MLEHITKNHDLVLQIIAMSLGVICVVGIVGMIISACLDYSREVKQIQKDRLTAGAKPTAHTKQDSVSKYFAGMEDASSAMQENKSLARVIQASIAYDLFQSGVPEHLKWSAAKAVMRELFNVEIED